MQNLESRLNCHPAYLLSDVQESIFDQFSCISIVDNHQIEQKIFIYKNNNSSEFEVRICKFKSTDTFMSRNLNIAFKRYVANDYYASFFFTTFYSACLFITELAKSHPESLIRPVLESKKD